jgi:phage head maturation protease
MNTKNFKFEVKALGDIQDDKFYHIEGIASTPDLDSNLDIVQPSAMLESFQNFGLPKFPHQHELDQMPLGAWDSYEIRGEATILKGRIPKVDNEKLFTLIEMGAYGGLSIGYVVIEAEDENGNKINNPSKFKGVRIITKLWVIETSLVTIPCNEFAEILEIKSTDFDEETINKVKSFYEKENKGAEMKIETKGVMLAQFMNEELNDKITDAWNRSDWIASIARSMRMSVESIEEMLDGSRDLANEDQAYDLAWALDTFYDVIKQIAVKEKLDKLDSSGEENLETKNRFEKCNSLSDIEKELKLIGATNKESKTVISKINTFKEDLSDSDLEKKKQVEAESKRDADWAEIKSLINELN